MENIEKICRPCFSVLSTQLVQLQIIYVFIRKLKYQYRLKRFQRNVFVMSYFLSPWTAFMNTLRKTNNKKLTKYDL